MAQWSVCDLVGGAQSNLVLWASLCVARSLRALLLLQPPEGGYKKKDIELDRAGLHLLRCEGQLGEGTRRRRSPQQAPPQPQRDSPAHGDGTCKACNVCNVCGGVSKACQHTSRGTAATCNRYGDRSCACVSCMCSWFVSRCGTYG